MATIIDSLIVTLGLNSKPFQKGSKEAEASLEKTKGKGREVSKDLERSGKQGAEFFNQLQKSALKLFAVLTVGSGVVAFTKHVISTGAQLDRMSGRVGESVADLSRWQGAVRQSGGTAEGLLSTVQGITQGFTELKLSGQGPLRDLFQQLGISAVEAGKALTPLQTLRAIAEKLEGKTWSNADKANMLARFGIPDEGTINLLLKGTKEIDRLLAAQKPYTDSDARAARKAEESWERIKQNVERTTQVLVLKVVEAMERLTPLFLKFAEFIVPKLVTGFERMASAIEKAYEIAKKIGEFQSRIFGDKEEGGTNPGKAGAKDQLESLFDRVKSGDKDAARKYAEIELNSQMIHKPTPEQIENRAAQLLKDLPKLNKSSASAPISFWSGFGPNKPMLSGAAGGAVGSGSSQTVSIGEVNVYTQATDANGIARDMRGALIRQADTGMR